MEKFKITKFLSCRIDNKEMKSVMLYKDERFNYIEVAGKMDFSY